MQIAYWHLCLVYFMVFTIKRQTMAAAAFKGISAIYRPILFKFDMQIAYQHLYLVYFTVFTIKGQTKAAAAFKGILAIYGRGL